MARIAGIVRDGTLLALATVVMSSCGEPATPDSLQCGKGTVRIGNECVAQGGDAAGGVGASGGNGSGGAAGDSGGDVAMDAGTAGGNGYVFVQQEFSGGEILEHQLLASFDVWTPAPLCTFREVGPCRIDRCLIPTIHASAGEIGVSVDQVTRTVTPNPEAGMRQETWPGQLWSPGQALRIFATGAAVPAFQETVEGPGSHALLEPKPVSNVPVYHGEPLLVRWGDSGIGTAVIAFTGTSTTGESVLVKCSFKNGSPNGEGRGTIPFEALSDIGNGGVVLTTFAESYKEIERGGWRLRIAARTKPVSALVAVIR